jgi:hypothetical protein
MMADRKYIEVLLLLLAAFYLSDAAIIRVPGDQPTIQSGIDHTQNQDTVLVAPGIYNESIDYLGKNIVVASHFLTTGDTSYISQTIIHGFGLNKSLVNFTNGENDHTQLTGITVTNANNDLSGGAILIQSNAAPRLNHLVIENNMAKSGAGLYCHQASVKIFDTRFENNYAKDDGGALAVFSSNIHMENVLINMNSAERNGGGIYIERESDPVFYNVKIMNNAAAEGGGIYCVDFDGKIQNVILQKNSADIGAGIACLLSNPTFRNLLLEYNTATGLGSGGMDFNRCDPVLMRCTLRGNSTSQYGGALNFYQSSPKLLHTTIIGNNAVQGAGAIFCQSLSHPIILNSIIRDNFPNELEFYWSQEEKSVTIAYSNFKGIAGSIVTGDYDTVNWLEGNIDADPAFIGGDPFDYGLQSNSTCIDKGTTQFTWNSQVILDLQPFQYAGEKPDMGAYEYGYISSLQSWKETPLTFTLDQNYPNPFNYTTMINYQLPMNSKVELSIYNLLGQKITTLVSEWQPVGIYKVEWHADDFASGLYLYRLQAGMYIATRKMILIK